MSQITHPAETHSGTVTSWLPIASAYTSSKQCSSTFIRHIDLTGDGVPLFAFDINLGLYADPNLRCLPQQATAWWNQALLGEIGTTTLIGPIICPAAYTTATTSVIDSSSTFVACCPSDYDFAGVAGAGDAVQCTSDLTAGQVFTFGSELNDQTYSVMTTSYTDATSVFGLQVNGYIFASTSTSTSGSSTATNTSDGGSTGSTAAGSSSISSATSASAASNLSTGAIAGIAIGAAVGGCILSLIAAWFIMRHRRNRQGESLLVYGDGSYGARTVPMGELDNAHLAHELPGVGIPHEMTGYNKVAGI